MKRPRIKIKGERILSVSDKRITRYAVVFLCAMLALSSCGKANKGYVARVVENDSLPCYITDSTPLPSDTDSAQIAICQQLLKECAECGILDKAGQRVFKSINKHPNVSRYMELIDECTNEDSFADTVMEGDTWQEYVEYVITPRQEWCND